MSGGVAVRDASQKEFVKKFEELTYRHNRWEVWKDMVVLFATAISNAVDGRFRAEREKSYMDTIKRYTKEEAEIFPELMAQLVDTMEVNAEKRGFCDFLGEIFMAMGLGNDAGGQFFTPYDVCRAMAKMSMDKAYILNGVEKKGYVSVNDPACGAGATLIAAAETMLEWDVNYQTSAIFTAQDIDYTTALMCYIQLSLLGCAGYVRIGDTLADPMTGSVLHGSNADRNTWYTPMWFSDIWTVRRVRDILKRAEAPTGEVATACADEEKPAPVDNMPIEKAPVKPNKRPPVKTRKTEAEERPKEPEETEITYTVMKNGQLSLF